jgi:hypothetical protein
MLVGREDLPELWAFALNAFPAAARFYESALTLWDDRDTDRPALRFRRAKALQLANDPRGREALDEARDELLAADDRARAGEAEALLAETAWFSGDVAAARRCVDRAYDLVRMEPPSPSKASVLANVSRYRALGGDPEGAIEVGRSARDGGTTRATGAPIRGAQQHRHVEGSPR